MRGPGHTPEAPAGDSGCCSHLKILPACPGFTLCGSFLHQAQGLTPRLPCLPSSRSCLPWCKTGFALHTRSALWVEGVWILSRRESVLAHVTKILPGLAGSGDVSDGSGLGSSHLLAHTSSLLASCAGEFPPCDICWQFQP